MPLRVIQYPHPTLRHLSKPLKRVDPELRDMVQRMFELMYEHRGVGLAANQVDLPYRLFITNPKGDPKSGEERVFINPILRHPRGLVEAEEGCLSIPEVYAPVKRAEKIDDRRLRSQRPDVSIWNSTACSPASCSMKPTTSTASCSSTA